MVRLYPFAKTQADGGTEPGHQHQGYSNCIKISTGIFNPAKGWCIKGYP